MINDVIQGDHYTH